MIAITVLLLAIPLNPARLSEPPPPSLRPDARPGRVLDDDAADALAKILNGYQEAYDAFTKAIRVVQDDAERRRLVEEDMPDTEVYAQRVMALVADHPGSDVAWNGLTWVFSRARGGVLAGDALVSLIKGFPGDGRLGELLAMYARNGPFTDAAAEALAQVSKDGPNLNVRGQAAFALSFQYKGLAARATDESLRAELRTARVEQLKRVCEQFGDVPYFNGYMRTAAEGELFEIQKLQIGMVVPDIESKDTDGVSFKLSSYRGKVVVLDFWAHQMRSYRAEYAHGRSLMERLADKPFALIGVNGDGDLEKLRGVLAEEKITWRSFWNGPKGLFGPISTRWNVRSWPALYVLDARGIIRFKNVRGEALDKAVDELLAEMNG